MKASISFTIDKSLFLRDPEQTPLGKKIVSQAIVLIDEHGFDAFNFKMLANQIESTEASVYRYFRNKHQLLCYCVSWYWTWLEYLIEFRTNNISDPKRKLEIAIATLLESDICDPNIPHIDESILHRVVVSESARVYMMRLSDGADYKSILHGYKLLCDQLMGFIKAINPKYKYARELMETLISTAHNQIFQIYQSNDHKAVRADHQKTEAFLNHLILDCVNS